MPDISLCFNKKCESFWSLEDNKKINIEIGITNMETRKILDHMDMRYM